MAGNGCATRPENSPCGPRNGFPFGSVRWGGQPLGLPIPMRPTKGPAAPTFPATLIRPRHLMFNKLTTPSLGLLLLLIASAVSGQTPAPPAGQPVAPGLRKLTGSDARRAEELDKAIAAAL